MKQRLTATSFLEKFGDIFRGVGGGKVVRFNGDVSSREVVESRGRDFVTRKFAQDMTM